MHLEKKMPVALTIAGSDSCGGAGIQADLKTFQALGCFGVSALTAVTCQNTQGVFAVQEMRSEIAAGQIRAVLDDLPADAAKTGMLFSEEIIEAIETALDSYSKSKSVAENIPPRGAENNAPRPPFPLVVDPVMVATSGDRLLKKSAERALLRFLRRATCITPNIPEAETIINRGIASPVEMENSARAIYDLTGAAVLLKGGHLANTKEVVDIFFDGEIIHRLLKPKLGIKSIHGTGCTLSAALTAGLARGLEPLTAVIEAKDFLHGAIEYSPRLGSGSGLLNHLWMEQRE